MIAQPDSGQEFELEDGPAVGPQPGPQESFFESTADIIIYGGQAGGGKTWSLVAEPLRWRKIPGFTAAIFRRTYPQLSGPGGVWTEANELYRQFEGRLREGKKLDATFPSGAYVAFLHLQHEKTKYEYQGHQICALLFDELTHFTQTQFTYLLSRNRSKCGVRPYVRATCNPQPGWVADFIDWWIDPESGLAIDERSGVIRYVVYEDDQFFWGDTEQDIIDRYPAYADPKLRILTATFIPASLDDNPALLENDPGYKSRLMLLPKVERERLLGGNWKIAEGSLVEPAWLNRYWIKGNHYQATINGVYVEVPHANCRRIATIDTAGTTRDKAEAAKGEHASPTVVAIWDMCARFAVQFEGRKIELTQLLFLRHVWRKWADWTELKTRVPDVLESWNVSRAYIENAHYGKPLKAEIKDTATELVGPVIPGMASGALNVSTGGAKLERAVAAGLLGRLEDGKLLLPADGDETPWLRAFISEFLAWTGLPKQPADQIDVSSYACYVSKKGAAVWGGVVNTSSKRWGTGT